MCLFLEQSSYSEPFCVLNRKLLMLRLCCCRNSCCLGFCMLHSITHRTTDQAAIVGDYCPCGAMSDFNTNAPEFRPAQQQPQQQQCERGHAQAMVNALPLPQSASAGSAAISSMHFALPLPQHQLMDAFFFCRCLWRYGLLRRIHYADCL